MTQKSKHTPGPWEVRKVKDVTEVVGYLLPNAPQLIFDPCRMDEANARLIAAAPEMYELLSALDDLEEGCLDFVDCDKGHVIGLVKDARRIKAAIDGEG